jgi:2-oxoglutarate ferredoxin oxidoreductase subunit delta
MKNVRGTVVIEIESCKGCELCIGACPQESIALSTKINALGYRYAVLAQENCTGCVNCALVCPDSVIRVYRAGKKSASTAATPAPAVNRTGRPQKAAAAGVEAAPVGRVDL